MSNIHMVPQMKIIAAFFQFYIIINFGIWTAARTNDTFSEDNFMDQPMISLMEVIISY